MKVLSLANFSIFDDGNLEAFAKREMEVIENDIRARPCDGKGKTSKRKLRIELEFQNEIIVEAGRFKVSLIEVTAKVMPAILPGYKTNSVPTKLSPEGFLFNEDTNSEKAAHDHPDQGKLSLT